MDTKIISLTHSKGGVGKSTMTLYTANTLAKKNQKVIIYDCDEQGTIYGKYKLHNRLEDTPSLINVKQVEAIDNAFMCELIELQDSNKYDFIFIDMPGRGHDEKIQDIMLVVDYALIPMMYGDSDLLATFEFVKKIKAINRVRENKGFAALQTALFFNNMGRTKKAKEVMKATVEELESKIGILKHNGKPVAIHTREYYKDLGFNDTPFSVLENLNTVNLIEDFKKYMLAFVTFIKD